VRGCPLIRAPAVPMSTLDRPTEPSYQERFADKSPLLYRIGFLRRGFKHEKLVDEPIG
jgi:hypothetical protein